MEIDIMGLVLLGFGSGFALYIIASLFGWIIWQCANLFHIVK